MLKYKISSDVLVQDLGGESVLLNLQTERYFGLDDVGTMIWSALTQAESQEAAYAQLLATYEVEPEQLRQDLTDLIGQLIEHGLLEPLEE
jgi:Coenzyme PQQ synthesis protein D (PqqD)